MRYARLVFAVLAFSTVLVAADPFAGTWKVNPSKSKFKTGSAPKEQTVTITESGSDLDVAVKGTAADNTPISVHYTIPANGGTGKIMESPYEAVSGKRMSERERETMYSKAGKVVYTTHATLSTDGKTLTVHSKGTNPAGQKVDGTVTYEKQ